ncbi:MAG: hypothetical protein Q8K32_22155 [Archangium sp.]|nr:hypothetical protein [Archangium sp.]
MAQGLFERIAENPFYVLGVSPTASRTELEREGNKLLSMLQLGLKESKVYRSPVGEHPRTEEAVRAAMAELRDPKRRLVHELLASLPVSITVPRPVASRDEVKWPRAPVVFGYGPEREG